MLECSIEGFNDILLPKFVKKAMKQMLLTQNFPFSSHDLDWEIKSQAGITKSRALWANNLAQFLRNSCFRSYIPIKIMNETDPDP